MSTRDEVEQEIQRLKQAIFQDEYTVAKYHMDASFHRIVKSYLDACREVFRLRAENREMREELGRVESKSMAGFTVEDLTRLGVLEETE